MLPKSSRLASFLTTEHRVSDCGVKETGGTGLVLVTYLIEMKTFTLALGW
jgi:hypothetical protein